MSAETEARVAPYPRPRHAAIAGMSALLLGISLSRFAFTPLIPALVQAGWFTAAQAGYLGATNLAGYLIGAAIARRAARHVPAMRSEERRVGKECRACWWAEGVEKG